MARKRSNQRITKIKKDFVLELLKKAEATDVADACVIQVPGSDLIPYPNMTDLRNWTRDYLLKGVNKLYQVKLDDDGQTYLTTIVDGLPLFTKLTKTIDTGDTENPTVETSKPGLWLSNLVAPVSNSLSGSWLRHNLIHDNESSYDYVNSDIIGNYAYSFFQRGIIHRTNGSTHSDNDSYCQHWSPSALGTISHDAIVIPKNLLRSTYTSYQTLVVPTDPDMQYYSETLSKDVEFDFSDNNNNEPPSITQFNGRVVGDGWTYELEFKGNGHGSGSDYGDNPSPDSENGNNGGCVTGTIVYADSNLGSTCVQEVNSCFQTTQSFFNPDVPDLSDYELLDDDNQTYNVITTDLRYIGCCSGYVFDIYNSPDAGRNRAKITGTYTCSGASTACTMGVKDNDSGEYVTSTDNWTFGYTYSACGVGGTHYKLTNVGPVNEDCNCASSYCGSLYGTGVLVTQAYKEYEDEEGINIYFIIVDLKKQYEEQGLPWSGGCGTARFTYYYSTKKCEESYCRNFLIAENVDINSLGDISKILGQIL